MAWRAPRFWHQPAGLAARVLAPLGAAYGAATARCMRRAGARVARPVVCVGNLTAGGAGKTPTTIALATMLRAMGEQPVVVSRGYGGRASGPLRVDPATHRAEDVGDEPLEIAAYAPCIVARNRPAGAAAAIAQGASVVLLDDGLQNPSLEKDLVFAVVDGEVGFGNGYCIPAGPLRAPVEAQAPNIDALIIVGGQGAAPHAALEKLPRFAADLSPDESAISALRGRRALAFAGIGRPEKFFAMLRAHGVDLVETRAFADHHMFSDADLAALAKTPGVALATTRKDFARIGADRASALLGANLHVVPVSLRLSDEDAMRALLRRTLAG